METLDKYKTGEQWSLVLNDDYSNQNQREATKSLESFSKGTFGRAWLELTTLETVMMSPYGTCREDIRQSRSRLSPTGDTCQDCRAAVSETERILRMEHLEIGKEEDIFDRDQHVFPVLKQTMLRVCRWRWGEVPGTGDR